MIFVHGDLFASLADIHFSNSKNIWSLDSLHRSILRVGKPLVVVYAHTHDCNTLLTLLSDFTAVKILLISHNSDGAIRDVPEREDDADARLIPSCLIGWFGQNASTNHPLVVAVPIGLERPIVEPHSKKIKKIREVIKNAINSSKELVYVNHVVGTNPLEREYLYPLFEQRSFAFVSKGGLDYYNYLKELKSFKFAVSPPGNGIDCHRTWECLYLGVIPIVKKSTCTQKLYSALPVLIVEDYGVLNENILRDFSALKSANDSIDFSFYAKMIIKFADSTKLRNNLKRSWYILRARCCLAAF